METVKKTISLTLDIPIELDIPISLDIPIDIEIVDSETGEVLGSGSGTVTVSQTVTASKTVSVSKNIEYTYERPTLSDYLVKGAAPATGASVLISELIKRMR